MENQEKYKTFLRAIKTLDGENRTFKRFLDDKRPTAAEKKLLKAMFALKKGKSKEKIKVLSEISTLPDFLEGFRYCVLGDCLNNYGDYNNAIDSYKKSLAYFKKVSEENYIFKTYQSIITTYVNLKDSNNASFYLNEIKKLPIDSRKKEAKLMQVEACYYSFVDEPLKALEIIDNIITKYEKEMVNYLSFLYVIKLVSLFKLNRVDSFSENLEKYGKLKGFKIKENYKYMLSMSKYIYNNSPIYVYKREFDSIPYLFHELNVVKSVDQNEVEEAKRSWDYLCQEQPDIFGDFLNYKGGETIFGVGLSHAIERSSFSNTTQKSEIDFSGINSVQDKILYVLNKLNGKASREQIIQLVWSEEVDEFNIVKLSNQISRIRKRLDGEITLKGDYYYLKPKKAS